MMKRRASDRNGLFFPRHNASLGDHQKPKLSTGHLHYSVKNELVLSYLFIGFCSLGEFCSKVLGKNLIYKSAREKCSL